MKEYIREHFVLIVALTVFMICVLTLAGAKETLALMLPHADDLHLIHYNMDDEIYTYEYTGKEVTPKLNRLVVGDNEGNTIIKYDDEFAIVSYKKNIEIGTADISLAINGYQGVFRIKDAFSIQPAKVSGMKMISTEDGLIELHWNPVLGADGYTLFKSEDGVQYYEIKEYHASDELIYQDNATSTNAVYRYYAVAFKTDKEAKIYGEISDKVHYNTPLATPVVTKIANMNFTTLQVQWSKVEGAVGYQIYHSLTPSGEFKCIAEIMDGAVLSYLDKQCVSAVNNYYYVKACQSNDGDLIWGNPSEVKSGMTTPNKVGLSGSGSSTDICLAWKQSAGAIGYEVYCSMNGGAFQLVARIEQPDVITWSDSGLEEHASYLYKIRPYCITDAGTVYGSYSGTVEKEPVIVYDYSGETGMDILLQYQGRPYVFGGSSPTKGWDCSYFVKWTYKTHFNIDLPRTAASQYSAGQYVNPYDRTSWQPGDLIFYTENGRTVSHVAVYLGNGQMIHALSTKWKTLVHDVDYYEKWDKKTSFFGIRRYF